MPCPEKEHTAKWNESERERYRKILKSADNVEVCSAVYDDKCIRRRNEKLVELSDCCVCYYNKRRIRSGTGQTVRIAQKKGIELINIYYEQE